VGAGAFVLARDGQRFALCSSIDAQDIAESGLFQQVIKYQEGLAGPLRDLIARLQPRKIALNYSKEEHLCDGLTLGRFRWLQQALAGCFEGSFVSSESFLKDLRSVKSPEEIRRIQKAIDITLDIYDAVFAQLRPGLSEKQIGQMFVREMEDRGVVSGLDKGLSAPIVMKGNIAHRPPSDSVVESGDMLIIDFSVDYEGYVSDIARTAYFLQPGETDAPPEMKYAFESAYGAISAGFAALKPGVVGWQVDQAARQYLLDRGMPEITHATGHQIGRETHDGGALLGPRWERYGAAPYGVVQENNVFTLEPTILPDTKPFILTEENVLVTANGAQYLSRRQESLVLIRP
jgi:Xaa-Pro aminopeptidase